jgi:hypothetical protein
VTVPVLEELAGDKRRITKIQLRGNWQNLGDEVREGVPDVFHDAAAGGGGRFDRLALAKWLVDAANPLTARVIVNRLWERLFGIGIVPTSEEFGSQGDLPSHPELLDWLACELVESGWNLKALQRLIVTSAAYRQTSKCPPDLVARDPENRLLACGPRVRLSAEVIRDQALAAAGLLSRKKGGPSVKPPQPNLGLAAAFGGGIDWQTSTGEDRYRRAIYTTWRRSNPYPSMATFDAPSREVCTVRRPRSNTPLQALVTLNDPAYVEAAQALARRMVREGGSAADTRAARGFRLVARSLGLGLGRRRCGHGRLGGARLVAPAAQPGGVFIQVAVEGLHVAVCHAPEGFADQADQVAVVRDQHDGAREIAQGLGQRLAHVEVEMVGGFVEQQHVGLEVSDQGQSQPRALAAGEAVHRFERAVADEVPAAEVIAQHLLAGVGRQLLEVP